MRENLTSGSERGRWKRGSPDVRGTYAWGTGSEERKQSRRMPPLTRREHCHRASGLLYRCSRSCLGFNSCGRGPDMG